jgi:hypothetical protein
VDEQEAARLLFVRSQDKISRHIKKKSLHQIELSAQVHARPMSGFKLETTHLCAQ